MGKTEKNGKKIKQVKWPQYQKPKDENMGWTKHVTAASQKISDTEALSHLNYATIFRLWIVNCK